MPIHYRQVNSFDDLRQMIDLQRLIWGENPEAHIPMHVLHSLAMAGSPIIGAFEDDDLLVGFSVGFFGMDVPQSNRPAMANLKIASKRLAVHPDYRSNGIGYQLKIEQRRFANDKGVRMITWPFDPLLSRNAYLYIHKLGAIVRRFVPDYYMDMPGQLESVGASDRFICDWWVTSNRVEERINGTRKSLTLQHYLSGETPIVNPGYPRPDGSIAPALEVSLDVEDKHLLLVEIPSDHRPLVHDPLLGEQWRLHTRELFSRLLGMGYVATDFVHDSYEGHERSFYLMGFDGA